MTSTHQRSILVVLLLVLGLFLVGCERPMPGDNDVSSPVPPAETGSTSESEIIPGPPVVDTEDTAAAYPAPEESEDSDADTEVSPVPEESEDSDSGTDAYLALENDVDEGESADDDVVEVESAEGQVGETEVVEDVVVEQTEESEFEAESSDDTPVAETGRTHIVAAGENLFRISMQYGISWVTLAEVNGLANADSITVGQVLIIPDEEPVETSEPVESSDTTADEEVVEGAEETEAAKSEPDETAAEEVTYIVQSDDNLYQISLKFGVSMMEIARANGLEDFNQVEVGRELLIPQGAVVESVEEEVTHIVGEGETVFGIAFQYGISWTELVQANGLQSPYSLEAGQSLIIPSGE